MMFFMLDDKKNLTEPLLARERKRQKQEAGTNIFY
jgi:hypothetical protein